MDIKIYTGYETYSPRGTLTISYDRITHINLYIPTGFYMGVSPERIAAEWEAERTGIPLTTHHIYQTEVDYKFQVKKLSKAEIPYRKAGMTHRVLSNDLMNYINKNHLYTKLTWWEVVSLKYNLNRFVWQTQEFKKHIYFHIGTNMVSAILGVIGTLLVIKGCDKGSSQSGIQDTQKESDSTKAINQMKPEDKNGGVDSTAQYSLIKKEDSLQNKKTDSSSNN